MLLYVGRIPTLVISSAKAAQEVMKAQDAKFASRPQLHMASKFFYGCREVAFAPYGDYWRQVRRITVLHVLNAKRALSFNPVREEEVAILVAKIRRCAASSDGSVKLSDLFFALARDVTCRAAFGRKYSEEGDERRTSGLLRRVNELLGSIYMGELNPWLGWIDWLRRIDKRVDECSKEMDDILVKVVNDHIARAEKDGNIHDQMGGKDFVDVLLSINQEDKEVSIALSKTDIKAIVFSMYAAGTDTSFSTMEWTMKELIKHPEEMKRVQDEIRAVMAYDTNKPIKEEHLEKMTYLKAVIKEILRLHAPAPLLLPRESIEDAQLLGYAVPAKTRVLINAWAIGRDPNYWEKAEEFMPERFLDSDMDFRGQDFNYIPFGSGRRGCPGINFATAIIELALANVLLHFDWELPDGRKGETLDTSIEAPGLTPHIKPNLVAVAKPWVA